jgi:hypothetical protein
MIKPSQAFIAAYAENVCYSVNSCAESKNVKVFIPEIALMKGRLQKGSVFLLA